MELPGLQKQTDPGHKHSYNIACASSEDVDQYAIRAVESESLHCNLCTTKATKRLHVGRAMARLFISKIVVVHRPVSLACRSCYMKFSELFLKQRMSYGVVIKGHQDN